ncbi:MAG: AMP-binding protein, partial [Desulfatiglandaceae bacterium]
MKTYNYDDRNKGYHMNLIQCIHESALQRLEKPAVDFEGIKWTYRDFSREIQRHAGALRLLGLREGDRVAFQLPKCPEFLFLHFAALSLGAVSLPLNSDYKSEEIHYFLTDSGTSFFVTDRERYLKSRDKLEGIKELQILLVDDKLNGFPVLGSLLERVTPSFFVSPVSAQDEATAMICYTSGTTGRSKGAMITHGNLISNSNALAQAWQWTERDTLLHVLPLFHVHGLNVAVVGSLLAGASIYMHEKFNPAGTWKTIEEKRCTMFMAVPTIYQRMVNELEGMKYTPDLSSMRVFISGSAPLSDNLFHRFEKLTGFRILERYGMTETAMNTSNALDPAGRKPKSVGFALPGITIRVVGKDGRDMPGEEVGEVLIKGPNVFAGYWRKPDKTRESFIGGYFRSGDMGFLDEADGGRLFLVGRSKELIISGGYN